MNRSPARIVELLKVRRTDAMISLAEKLESNFWDETSPGAGPSATDNKSPFGARYYIVYDTGTPTIDNFDLSFLRDYSDKDHFLAASKATAEPSVANDGAATTSLVIGDQYQAVAA